MPGKTKTAKTWTKAEALEALKNYCSYQERSEKQVMRKIQLLGLQDVEEYLITALKEAGFLDDERFAENYVRGKSRLKGWGPKKIEALLARETGTNTEASELLNEEDAQAAQIKFWKALEKKWEKGPGSKTGNQFKASLIRFGLGRGFSLDLTNRYIQLLEQNSSPEFE